jgi:cold shock CspA family protein
MTTGVVTKLVTSFGSEWGRIRVARTGADCFFNRKSMLRAADFASLALGQEVKFNEEPDRVNGSRAERMTLVKANAVVEAATPNTQDTKVGLDGRQ